MVILIVCFTVCSSLNAIASPLSDARQAFSQGNLPKTIQTLEGQLFPSSKLGKTDTIPALELFGISQFMMGDKKAAEKAFKVILNVNSRHKLDKKFALDPAVEPYFESLKKTTPPAKTTNNRRERVSRAQKKTTARPSPPPAKARPKPRPTPKPLVTALQVQTNAPKTTLFIDGIFIGSAGQIVTVEPGQHQLTISAEGYESVEKKISIPKGKTLKMSVRMTKPGESKRIAAAKRAQSRSNIQTRKRQNASFDDSGPKKSVRFDVDLPGEKKGRSKPKSRSKRNLADQYLQEQPSQPAYPPQYQQAPMYQSPMPAYPQPQYGYPYPPPAYPMPGYAPQYAPPAYAYPQPDPYAAPAYPTPPANAYGAPNPYEEEYEAGDGAVPAGGGYPPPSSGGYRSRRRDNGRSAFLALLPLGVGQYQNGHKVKGTLFLLSELGLPAYGYFYYDNAIKAAQKVFEQEIADEKNPDYVALPEEELQANQKRREDTLKKYANYQLYCYIGAGVLYVVGVIDAFAFINEAPSRSRAEIQTVPTERALTYRLLPTPEGGVHLKLSLNLD